MTGPKRTIYVISANVDVAYRRIASCRAYVPERVNEARRGSGTGSRTTCKDLDLQAVSERLNLIATELQEEVRKTRQPPIGNIWNEFPHPVRDLAHSCGKEARLEREGKTPNSTAHMQDRGPIIPLVRLSPVLPTPAQSAFRQHAVV